MSNKCQEKNSKLLPIDKLIDSTFDKLKDIVDANTVIGSVIKLTEEIQIVPISKVSVGLISGGGEMPGKKKNNSTLTGGSTTGFSVTPIGFISINNNCVDYIGTSNTNNVTNKLFDAFLAVYEKVMNKLGNSHEE